MRKLFTVFFVSLFTTATHAAEINKLSPTDVCKTPTCSLTAKPQPMLVGEVQSALKAGNLSTTFGLPEIPEKLISSSPSGLVVAKFKNGSGIAYHTVNIPNTAESTIYAFTTPVEKAEKENKSITEMYGQKAIFDIALIKKEGDKPELFLFNNDKWVVAAGFNNNDSMIFVVNKDQDGQLLVIKMLNMSKKAMENVIKTLKKDA